MVVSRRAVKSRRLIGPTRISADILQSRATGVRRGVVFCARSYLLSFTVRCQEPLYGRVCGKTVEFINISLHRVVWIRWPTVDKDDVIKWYSSYLKCKCYLGIYYKLNREQLSCHLLLYGVSYSKTVMKEKWFTYVHEKQWLGILLFKRNVSLF